MELGEATVTTLIAIDPGLANTGCVVFEDDRITAAVTFTTDASGPTTTFADAMTRCSIQTARVDELICKLRPAHITCETFRDIPGRLRTVKRNAWATPLLIGFLAAGAFELAQEEGRQVHWQDPELVLTRYGGIRQGWKAGRFGVVEGDTMLTNEHLRAAGCHGLFRLDLLRGPKCLPN